MYGLDNASGVNVMPKIAPVGSASPLWFTEGGAGLAASYPGQDWFNMVQAELLNVLTAGGVKPEKGKLNQLADAISKIISKDGYATKEELKNKIDKDSAANLLRLTTDSSDALRMRSADYSAMLHQNNLELFILLTNKGDRDGKYNALRPFRVNLESGKVTLDDVIINALTLTDFRIFNERYLGINNPATSAKKLENPCRIAGHVFDGNGNDIKITSSDIKANSYVFYFQKNQSWSVPAEFVGRLAKVTAYGAGGGGSSKTMNGVRRSGMMGGFGGLAEKLIRLGASHNIVVGGGGLGGAYTSSNDAGTGGGNGGTSSFDGISATGGNGAASQASVGSSTADATHGYGAGGDIDIVGGGAVGGSAGQNNDAVDGSGRKGGDGYIVVEVLS